MRAYSGDDLKGRDLRTDAGAKLIWQSHASDRSANLMFIVANDQTICRYLIAGAALMQKCFAPPAGADFGEEFGGNIFVVSPSRILVNHSRLFDFSESNSSYSISPLPHETQFCGETGHLGHYLYRLCDEEASLIRLDTPEPAVRRITMNAPVTAISIEETERATTVFAADNKGGLSGYRIRDPELLGADTRHSATTDMVKLAEGKLDSRARINAILASFAAKQDFDQPTIYTADGNGEVWRWQGNLSSAGQGILEQAIRIHAHRGIAVSLASVLRNKGKEKWLASAGSDGLVLLSPEAIGPLLAEAAGVFDEITDNASAPR